MNPLCSECLIEKNLSLIMNTCYILLNHCFRMHISSSGRATRAYKTLGSQRRISTPLPWGKILWVTNCFIIKQKKKNKKRRNHYIGFLCWYSVLVCNHLLSNVKIIIPSFKMNVISQPLGHSSTKAHTAGDCWCQWGSPH